jgi:hypothetical protein
VRSFTHKFKTESKEYRKKTEKSLVAHTAKRARMKRIAQRWLLQGQAATAGLSHTLTARRAQMREEWITNITFIWLLACVIIHMCFQII